MPSVPITIIAASSAASSSAFASSLAAAARHDECLRIIAKQDLSNIEAKQQYAECVVELYPSSHAADFHIDKTGIAVWLGLTVFIFSLFQIDRIFTPTTAIGTFIIGLLSLLLAGLTTLVGVLIAMAFTS